MTQTLNNSIPIFLDASGKLLDGGYIYVGVANADPQTMPIILYWDVALTQVAEQPIRTIGGLIVNGNSAARVFLAEDDYSQRVLGFDQTQIDYSPSVFSDTSEYQKANADLSTIAGQSNTSFGLSLLTLANAAALAQAAGVTTFTGGTVSTNITRQGAGVVPYFADSAMTGGRIFDPVPVGTALSISQPGDCQGTY